MNRAVFLDRDGVLNEAPVGTDGVPRPPAGVADLHIISGTAAALRRLRSAGFLMLVVANQPEVARGTLSMDAVEEVNDKLSARLPIDAVYVCPHTSDACDCRKPKPGMILDAADDWDVDLAASWLIGDRWVDVTAALAAGVRPVLLERRYSWDPTSSGSPEADLGRVPARGTIAECVSLILGRPAAAPPAPGH